MKNEFAEKYIECRNHRNCGGWCETGAEIEAGLCEDCLQEEREREDELALLREQRDKLLAAANLALDWNQGRKNIMPLRVREPLIAAVIFTTKGLK